MGYTSTQENLLLFLNAFERILREEGYHLEPGAGVSAAIKSLNC